MATFDASRVLAGALQCQGGNAGPHFLFFNNKTG